MRKPVSLALLTAIFVIAPVSAKKMNKSKVETKAPEKVAYKADTKVSDEKAQPTDAGLVKVREEFKHMRPVSDFSVSVY